MDLEFVRTIYQHFINDPLVPFEEIKEYIENNTNLLRINSGTKRNEGYLISTMKEKE